MTSAQSEIRVYFQRCGMEFCSMPSIMRLATHVFALEIRRLQLLLPGARGMLYLVWEKKDQLLSR